MEETIRQTQLHLQQRNYSYSTQKTYLGMLKVFLHYFQGEDLAQLTEEQIRTFLVETCYRTKLSLSYQNQMINSIKRSTPDSTWSKYWASLVRFIISNGREKNFGFRWSYPSRRCVVY
ncbi:MAG: phage integrase N-terminal SAM-like domain-containing protein [Tunicatimonas sp.]|uniref:phage integrase N-terminal SAM-like domain-containing protein n=1 Tax=Tunicatimonas sp. TaxID=1940096 RepID=UPI003C737546